MKNQMNDFFQIGINLIKFTLIIKLMMRSYSNHFQLRSSEKKKEQGNSFNCC